MRPALFLDRDGVINIDRDYVHRIEDFEWQPGIFDLARIAQAADYPIVVVTNQSGIGRGYYTEADFQRLTQHMMEGFAREGIRITAIYHCPYHPDAIHDHLRHPDHPWRKPRPGMLLAARTDLAIDMPRSIMIGDRLSDIQAGAAAGVGTVVLVGDADRDVKERHPGLLVFRSVAATALWLAAEVTRRK